jgi:hypothetical protein
MPYLGDLKQATAYTINVDNGPIVAGKTCITIVKINRRERVASAETESIAAGVRTGINDTAAARIDRIIIQVHPPANATVNVEVVQGLSSFTQACVGDTEMVFDTVP